MVKKIFKMVLKTNLRKFGLKQDLYVQLLTISIKVDGSDLIELEWVCFSKNRKMNMSLFSAKIPLVRGILK